MAIREIKHTFSFSQPPSVVWRYLTEPELLALWLMPGDIKPVVGHTFQMRTKPKTKLRFDGTVYCEVLEVVPEQKLVYSWKGGMSQSRPMLDSIVAWTLEPTENGTDLHLVHSGFKGVKNYLAFVIMRSGWKKIGLRLYKHLNLNNHGHSPA